MGEGDPSYNIVTSSAGHLDLPALGTMLEAFGSDTKRRGVAPATPGFSLAHPYLENISTMETRGRGKEWCFFGK